MVYGRYNYSIPGVYKPTFTSLGGTILYESLWILMRLIFRPKAIPPPCQSSRGRSRRSPLTACGRWRNLVRCAWWFRHVKNDENLGIQRWKTDQIHGDFTSENGDFTPWLVGYRPATSRMAKLEPGSLDPTFTGVQNWVNLCLFRFRS